MTEPAIGIIGMGQRLPDTIRTNDDPIFDWLRTHHPDGQDCFIGYDQRRVLEPNETVLDILVPAAQKAMNDAGIDPGQIDHVIGCVSPNTFLVPVDLFDLTRRLGLRETVVTIPLGNDFSNFNIAVVLADAMVRSGRARNVLVAIGGGWTRAVEYHTPQAASVGDGAAAAVIGVAPQDRAPQWTLVDSEVITREMNFGQMVLVADRRAKFLAAIAPGDPDPLQQNWTGPYFHIDKEGLANFKLFGGEIAPQAALRVLKRQGIAAADVTITGHQVSQALFGIWMKALAPAHLFETLRVYGNMTVANIPVNLCLMTGQVRTPYAVGLSLAPDMHAHALLLRAGPQQRPT